MKLCMIGDRGHNRYVLDGLPNVPHVRVAALSPGSKEDNVDALKEWCDAHGHSPQIFEDYGHMLDEVKPDVVSVCGPFELHAEMSIEALRRGIHVFCEKPVALTLPDLDRLKTAYAEAQVGFGAMLGLRYAPEFYSAWRAVRDGAVGSVRLVNTRKSYRLGQRPSYYTQRETYGGTIPWVGIHAIDWILWFSGERFLSVHARHSAQYNHGFGDLEVSALCQFTLSNEVLASASVDYLRPATASTHGDDWVRIVGTAGVIEVRQGKVYVINDDAIGEVELPAANERQIFEDFIADIEGKGKSLLDAQEIFAATEACLLARQSADTGRTVLFERAR